MNNYRVFLVATAKDFNNHILPFAFSLVPVENYDNWVWFLKVVREALEECQRFTVLSDRQKGLLLAVSEVFPLAGHRFCLRHIKSNINSKGISLTGLERGLINDMARSDCESDYKVFEKELERTKPAAVAYLNGIDKTHWVKYKYQEHFKLPTYGETTSNLTEQANSWIGNECRSAKPLDAFALYFRKLSELVSGKRQMGVDWLAKRTGAELVPQLPSERKSLVIAAELCKVTPCMEGAYNVIFLGKSKHPGFIHPWRLVDLPARECTCGNWQDKEFPCVHAVATSVKEGQALDTLYYVKRMSIDHFRETYMAAFRPWPTDVTLGTDLTIRVPPIQSDPPELGKRGLKPGPKPKHKRKKTKSGN